MYNKKLHVKYLHIINHRECRLNYMNNVYYKFVYYYYVIIDNNMML